MNTPIPQVSESGICRLCNNMGYILIGTNALGTQPYYCTCAVAGVLRTQHESNPSLKPYKNQSELDANPS
jgi:hypothetical protein